jgi:hypothetical protein
MVSADDIYNQRWGGKLMVDLVARLRKGARRVDVKPADNNLAERTLAAEAAHEIERLRYVIKGLREKAVWKEPKGGGPNY